MAKPSIHATAVLVGSRAVLIQGPSGSGKSRLALALLEAGSQGRIPFARLVADDRTCVEAVHGRLLARPVESLAGMLEVRGVGIRRLPYEALAVVGLIVELGKPDAARLPDTAQNEAQIEGVFLPRLTFAPGTDPLPAVLAYLGTTSITLLWRSVTVGNCPICPM